MGIFLVQRQAIEEPSQLAFSNGLDGFPLRRPLELSAFQTEKMQPETATAPVQDFDLVAVAVAKDKKTSRERVQLEALFHQYRQAINRLPQVCYPCSQKDTAIASFV